MYVCRYATVSGKTSHIVNFMKFYVSCIFDELYPRANLPPSLRPTVHFTLELERFVCDRATPMTNEKLRPKGIAMYAYSVFVYYVYTGSQLMSTWAEPLKRLKGQASLELCHR